MKEKELARLKKAKQQRSLPSPDHATEQKREVTVPSHAREAGQYVSGKAPPTATAVHALQHTVGNARLQRALESQQETGGEAHPGLADELARERGGGQPLPSHVQEGMERAFGEGHDFSGVRVHTTPQADALNRRLRAQAFTAGQDILFREGEFAPETASGQKLLAHELAHVVQQSEGVVDSAPSAGDRVVVGAPDDAFEQAADRLAEAIASGPTSITTRAAPNVQQQAEEEEELLQTQPIEEEEELLQTQPIEEEEELLQTQPIEEEEEELQA